MNPQDRRIAANLSMATGTHARPNARPALSLHHEGLAVQRKGVALRRTPFIRDDSWAAHSVTWQKIKQLSSNLAGKFDKRSREDLESQVQAIIDSDPSNLAILDESGFIRLVNQAWRLNENLYGFAADSTSVGHNYLELCESLTESQDKIGVISKGLSEIQLGKCKEFHQEYYWVSAATPRWVQMWAAGFNLPALKDSFRILVRHENIVSKKQPADSLKDEQRHLLNVLDNIFSFVVILAPDGTVIEANRTALEWAGTALADVAGEKFWDCCWWDGGSEVRSEICGAFARAASGKSAQCRLNVRTILGTLMDADFKLAPIKDDLGRITHVIVSGIDITENKKIEDAYRDISGRLICIQDEERRRIARELHDDLGQRMALLAIELEQLEQGVSKRSSQLHPRIRHLLVKTQQISADILRLSHESHPSILDHLGLVAGVQGFCDELCRHHTGLKIEFRHQGVPTRLHADIRLSLFRIIQEALHNVIKHSGSTSASIVLEKTDQKIYLSVSDQGCGFESSAVRTREGLGLVSIRERAHLVGGTISIKSQPSRGTQIEVSVPLTGHP